MANKTNCIKNGKAMYRLSKVVGHKADGSAIRKNFFAINKKEAEKKLEEYLKELNNGLDPDNKKVSVSELFKTWLFTVKIHAVRPTTFVKYEGDYRLYIKPATFSSLAVTDVKKLHIQNFYNKLFEKDNKSHEKIKSVHKILHAFFEYCIDERVYSKKPM